MLWLVCRLTLIVLILRRNGVCLLIMLMWSLMSRCGLMLFVGLTWILFVGLLSSLLCVICRLSTRVMNRIRVIRMCCGCLRWCGFWLWFL